MKATHAPWTQAEVDAINNCNRYLLGYVLRPADFSDCTNNGISARHARLLIPHPDGPFEGGHAGDVCLEVIRPAFPDSPVRFKEKGETRWVMAGGNYVHTSDSRFYELYRAPISIHDRIE